jgi:hypothetical protein
MRRVFVGAMVLFAFSAGACSSSDDSGSGSSIALADLPPLIADAACKALNDCWGNASSLLLAGEDCKQRTTAAFSDAVPNLDAAVKKGSAIYNPDKAQKCVDAVRASGCNIDGALDSDACMAALDGTVALGGDCDSNIDCVGAAYCKSSGSCPGQCSALGSAGDVCSHDNQCATELSCSKFTNKCEKPAQSGETCGGGGVAPGCDAAMFCLGSNDKAGTTGTCQAIDQLFSAGVDTKCDPGAGPLCDPDLSCAIESIAAGPVFTAKCVAKVASGAACQVGFPDPCPLGEYCDGTVQNLSGACKKLPGDGAACVTGPFGDGALCAPYTRCDNGTCRDLADSGSSCASDGVCYSENCLNGKCAAAGACE